MEIRMPSFRTAVAYDRLGAGRQLRHLQDPFTDATIDPGLKPSERAQHLVVAYLRTVGRLLGVTAAHAEHLEATIGSDRASSAPGLQLRWGDGDGQPRPIRGGESTVCWIHQTQTVRLSPEPVDVWGAGLRIVVHHRPFRITSAVSTLLPDVDPFLGDAIADAQFTAPSVAELILDLLGVTPPEVLQAGGSRALIYRRMPEDVRDEFPVSETRPRAEVRPARPAAPLAGERDRLVIAVELPREPTEGDRRGYRVFLDPLAWEVVYCKALVACATQPTAKVFVQNPAAPPDDYSHVLDHYGTVVPLHGLPQPSTGDLDLTGDLVTIQDAAGQRGGPKVGAPYHFHFPSRTIDFAAANAYTHCDSLFRLVEAFGFPLDEYFDPKQFPVAVLPWAPIIPGPCVDGLCINAQVRQEPQSNRVMQFRFALADLSDVQNKLGLAADRRLVWHEFCHALLIAATGQPEFGFAHSAGDALGAIATDPESPFADQEHLRGVTFPWVWQPLRRHDRRVEDGWGWYGQFYEPGDYPTDADPGGYWSEQILSSTLFRLYRAVGGDALRQGAIDVARRKAASDYVLYLIVRAIDQLGDAAATPSTDPEDFATALMEADVATTVFAYAGAQRRGGALHKVIRWSFEQQGLYHPTTETHPQNKPGLPEPVDVYIDDGRAGEYPFTDEWEAAADALWLRDAPDGLGGDQPPSLGHKSYVYVRVDNRGTTPATGTTVEIFAAHGAQAQTWDGQWSKLAPAPGAVTQDVVPAGDWSLFGPFEWTPAPGGDHALLAVAGAPKDRANTVPSTGLACATGPIPVAELVPFDNNLGYRSWQL
jgi:hypothetical protein